MGITCKMNGGKNLKGIYSQKIFSMGITCKLNWENLHVISSQKKIIWESLVKWTQIKFKGKSNERKREISKKEKKIEERKEKKRLASLASLARAVLGKAIQLFQYAAVQTLAAGFQALCAVFIYFEQNQRFFFSHSLRHYQEAQHVQDQQRWIFKNEFKANLL